MNSFNKTEAAILPHASYTSLECSLFLRLKCLGFKAYIISLCCQAIKDILPAIEMEMSERNLYAIFISLCYGAHRIFWQLLNLLV